MTQYHPLPPFGQLLYPNPITGLSFDPISDALWAGHTSGSINAYHGASRMRGVTFPVGRGESVRRVVASETDILAAGDMGMGSWGKGGVNKWYYRSPISLTTFGHHPTKPNTLILSQAAPEMLVLNSATGVIVRTVPAPALVTHLRSSHSLLFSGAADGYIRTHDFRVGARKEGDSSEASILAHVGGLQGLEVSGNYAMTIGWGMRNSRPAPDPLVKFFDIRTLRPLPPITFPAGPALINVNTKQPNIVTITSSQGLINIVDMTKLNEGGQFHQLDITSYINCAAVSPSGAYIAFGDAEGYVHMLTSTSDDEHVPFNGFEGKEVEWADPPDPLPDIEWDNNTPLNIIGLPFYDDQLLSAYTPPLIPASISQPPPPKIPPQVLNAMKVQDFLQYAMLPKELRGKRNVVEPEVRKKDEGRFRSEQSRKKDEPHKSPGLLDYAYPEIPKPYRRVSIKYSKFGVEDFDFGYYNPTSYSGLETDIPNSYANALIQLLHYTVPVRRLAKSHITTNCIPEHCLLCELGFVVCMLEDARGRNLQARNFCMTISRKQPAQSFALIDRSNDGENADYSTMIQELNRFVLNQFAVEGNSFPQNPFIIIPSGGITAGTPAAAPLSQLLGVDVKTIIVCANCGHKRDKITMSHVVDLLYPSSTTIISDSAPPAEYDFASVLRYTLERDTSFKSTCQVCKHLAFQRARRLLSSEYMPPVMSVHASVKTEDHLRFWMDGKRRRFLEPYANIDMHNENGELAPGSEDSVRYELRGYIAEIRIGRVNHLVAIIKVPKTDTDPEDDDGDASGSPWYLFNDFAVENITEEEALSFPQKWKVPCILYLERTDLVPTLDFSGLPEELDRAILGQSHSITTYLDRSSLKHEVLRFEELPKPGSIISIDAEFVALQQEESELRSDGTKKVLKPSQLSLARVSVLRGDGPRAGVPFIDDYIYTSDTIVDYLTEYSGIRHGDLHPSFSTHTLLPLKSVYKKLRLLVDLGCIFIGHGLSKDFRIINIFVPPDRVLDTVDLYFIKERHRRLSLRFLSYFVLKEQIQIDTHDSIEDARAALLLYQEYIKYEEQGKFDELLDDLYREGKRLNWKIPEPPAGTPQHQEQQHQQQGQQQSLVNFGGGVQGTFSPFMAPPQMGPGAANVPMSMFDRQALFQQQLYQPWGQPGMR